MTQFLVGLFLYIFLILPPVANLLESMMVTHMHMQMPLLVIAGFLMASFFQKRFPKFFEKWNQNGIPGILLFVIIMLYWTIPRTMDEALTMTSIEVFKFISLPFLAGVPLRDSWQKISSKMKKTIFIFFAMKYLGMGFLYIKANEQLCNNYLLIDQITLGWGFLLTGICIFVYLGYLSFVVKKWGG